MSSSNEEKPTSNMKKDDEENNIDLSEIAYHVKLIMLTFHLCKLEKDKQYALLDFYGYWKNDFTRKVFLMFTSFYPTLTLQMSILPVKYIKCLDFHEEKHWNRNAFPIMPSFLEKCVKLESLERVFLDPEGVELVCKIPTVKKIAMELKVVSNHTMEHLSKLKKLHQLTIYPQVAATASLDFDEFSRKLRKLVLCKHSMTDSMFTKKCVGQFDKLLTLRIYARVQINIEQLETILAMKCLKYLKLYSCGLPINFIDLFRKKSIVKLDLSYSSFTRNKLKEVKEFQETLEKLKLTSVTDIPNEFFEVIFKSKVGFVKLDLEGCRMEQEIGEIIIENYPYSRLEKLNLRRNYQLESPKLKEIFEKNEKIDFLI